MADTLNVLSLFSGTGMLDVAVGCECERRGYAHRVLGYVERDACATALLLAGMEAACLAEAPVWCDDLAALDARAFLGRVDILTASPPCQPYSLAGKRRGNEDDRSHGDTSGGGGGPLIHLIRIIDGCRPAVVFLENVPAWVMGGHFRRFGEALSGLGYAIEDPIFLASSDLGAPHKRERVFILAVADAECTRLHDAPSGGADRAEGTAAGRAGEDLPLVPPGRNDFRGWAAVARLDPALMPAIESKISGVAHALAPVADSLRLGGNGVDPLVAAVAFGALCDRAGIFQSIGV